MRSSRLHTVSAESGTGWWQMVSREPVESLRGIVRRYTGYQEYSAVPVRRSEMPFGTVGLVLSFGPRIRVLDRDDLGTPVAEPTSFVATLGTEVAVTEYTGAQHGLLAMLTPLGASMVLGVPMGALRGETVELEDVLGAGARRLVGRLADMPAWDERFDALDDFFVARLSRARRPSPAAAFAWRELCATEGRTPIGSLVDRLGCSHRYLLSEFTEHVGVPPKSFARILRARRAGRLISAGDMTLGEVAAACGYSDHAHLSREFRVITGESPSSWAPGELAEVPELPEL